VAARKTTRKKSTKATRSRRSSTASRKRLQPSKVARGLEPKETPLALDDPSVANLVDRVRKAGGAPIGAYHEPLSGRPILLAVLPVGSVEATPFQRDLSPTHTKRLATKIDESGAFLDPLIVVEGKGGELWTPNGRHRLAAARVMGLRLVTALVSPDESLAFKILALNTEKAHNLRDRSLEVIRMARELAARNPRAKEQDYTAEFESAPYLTLGIVYEEEKRFAGSAYHPFLRRVDRFSSKTLRASLQQRKGWAARLVQIESEVKGIVEELRARRFRSPYLRTLVVARINPVRPPRRGLKGPSMEIGPALTKMLAAARRFDPTSIREGDLALVAAVASGDDE
jgi:ParB family chromosome partitioning protein